jgi:hypothetical protein
MSCFHYFPTCTLYIKFQRHKTLHVHIIFYLVPHDPMTKALHVPSYDSLTLFLQVPYKTLHVHMFLHGDYMSLIYLPS